MSEHRTTRPRIEIERRPALPPPRRVIEIERAPTRPPTRVLVEIEAPAAPCRCGDGSCMLCDDNGMVTAEGAV